uniref:Uncharacterized protein n=1 Tax=Latimeria chalumnae TaxID=7897 RepID=H2ZSI9_LATCH
KKKCQCVYNAEWETQFKWIVPDRENSTNAKCKQCIAAFTVKWDGAKAVKSHEKSTSHQQKTKIVTQNAVLDKFTVRSGSSEEDKVTLAEVVNVFHSIQHHHSYLSMDCGLKPAHKMFPDSNIAIKTSCGKAKCEAICCNVIAPHSVETVLKILSDASNKGNRKLFPLCVRYFTTSGIKDRVLDFYEDSDETLEAISAKIKLILKNCN